MTQPQVRRVDENGSVFISGVWRHWTETPRDGKWFYILALVQCRECQDGEMFTIAHYIDDKWVSQGGYPIENSDSNYKVYKWMNLELFYHHGLNYDVEE